MRFWIIYLMSAIFLFLASSTGVYFYLFQLSGLILLVAMIGSIVLTLRQRVGVKKQTIQNQVFNESSKAIEKKKPNIGEGVNV